METRAAHLLIGLFVLALIGLGFGFVYWIEDSTNGAGARRYYVIFPGSVQGLSEGSTVLFNGLRVGQVESLKIMPEDTRKVRGQISIRADTPVRETSRARIVQQGLAGVTALEITPGAPDSPPLRATKAGEPYPTIPALRSGAGSLLSGAPEALSEARALFARLNELMDANSQAVTKTIKHVESFTAMLDDNRAALATTIQNARDLSIRFQKMADKLETVVNKVAANLTDGDQSVVAQAQQAVQSFRQLAAKLDHSLGDSAGNLTQSAQKSLEQFQLFMRDGRRLANNLDHFVQKLERNPQSLLLGGSQVPEYKPRN